jgi:halocyanin-like protein
MSERQLRRRDALRATAAAAGVAGVAGLGGTASGQSPLSDWFSNVSNYDGVVDRTGAAEVTVRVGVEANGGGFGFGPAAVRVDPGTTVVWEWTGKGGSHNVVADDGGFASELVAEAGHTYSRTVEETGVVRYVCEPHAGVGMKGAVVVGDAANGAPAAGDSGDGDASGSGGGTTTPTATDRAAGSAGGSSASGGGRAEGLTDAALLVGGGVVGALVSPVVLGALLWATGRGEGPARMDERGRTYRPGDERGEGDGTARR